MIGAIALAVQIGFVARMIVLGRRDRARIAASTKAGAS
jgi:hypothetical protein